MLSGVKRKRTDEPFETGERWALTFNDIMTLMLTFFVLVLSMSSLDVGSLKDVHQEMATALGGTRLTKALTSGSEGVPALIQTPKFTSRTSPAAQRSTGARDADDPSLTAIALALRDIFNVRLVEEGGDRFDSNQPLGTQQKYPGIVDDQYYEPGIVVLKQRRGVVLRLPGELLFKTGDATVTERAHRILDAVAAALTRTDLQVLIEGHTDALPVVTRTYASNWELAVARSVSVAQYLIDRHGIRPERIGVSGYADCVPVAPNDTPQHRELNRRVEIVFLRRF